jgi:hypothetical protein
MKERIKVTSIFDINHFRYIPDDSPLTKTEKELLLLPRNKINEKKYEKFDTDFMLYLMKTPNSPVKTVVDRLFNNQMVFIGSDSKQNGTLGSFMLNSSEKMVGIGLDATDLDIDLLTGETSNIDQCVYATYFNFIRGVVLINRREIKANKELNELIVSYMINIIKKSINMPSALNPKQTIIYEAVVRQFYYQFMLFYDFDHAFDMFTLKEILPELQDEIEELFRTSEMNRYTQFRDIYKALYDLKVMPEPPNKMLMTGLSKLGMSQFLYVNQIIDYLIASIVLANYPAAGFSNNLFVNRKVQEQIEQIMFKYGSNVKYSPAGFKGV